MSDNILLVGSLTDVMNLQPLFQDTFVLMKTAVANFTDIIKIAGIFIKAAFIDPVKVKRIRN